MRRDREEVQKLVSEITKSYSPEKAKEIIDIAQENYYLDFVYVLKGFIEEKSNNPEKAIEFYKKVIELKPDYVGAYNQIGNCFQALNKLEEAIKWYNKNIETFSLSSTAIPYYNRGNCYSRMKKYDEAIYSYLMAIQRDKLLKDAYSKLLEILADLKQLDKFNELSEEISKIFLNDKGMLDILSLRWNTLGIKLHDEDVNKAKKCYENSIKFNPDYNFPYNNLALICVKEGKYEDAVSNYKKAISLDANYANAYYNLAACYSLMKDADNAIDSLKKAIALDGKYKEKAKERSEFNQIKNCPEFTQLVS